MVTQNPILKADFKDVCNYPAVKTLFGKTVFITGVTGFIGSMLAKVLLFCNDECRSGIKIIGLARDAAKVDNVFGSLAGRGDIRFCYNDLLKSLDIAENIDYIIHAASPTVSRYFITNPVETISAICLGTDNVLRLAGKKRVKKFIYISSMEMYGAVYDESKNRMSEEELGKIAVLNTRSSYSESKRLAECLCRSYFEEYSVPLCIARLAQTFGAGVSASDNRVFMQFAKSAAAGEDIVLHTKGESFGNYCYISDCLKALLLLIEKGVPGEAYNVVNESATMTIREMAQLVAKKIANGRSGVKIQIPEDQTSLGYAPDTKLRLSGQKLMALGWQPSVDLETAYSRMIEYLNS